MPQHILPHFVVCPANFSLNLHFTQSFQASYEVNILWRWFYFYRYSGLSEYCDKSGKVLKALSCIYFSLSPFCKWKILFDATNKWWNHSYIALYLVVQCRIVFTTCGLCRALPGIIFPRSSCQYVSICQYCQYVNIVNICQYCQYVSICVKIKGMWCWF